MKKKKQTETFIAPGSAIYPELLAITTVELMKVGPQTIGVYPVTQEDFRPYVTRAFSLLRMAHQYLEESQVNEHKA